MIDRRSLLVLAGSAAVSWPRLGYAAEVDMVAVPESTKARLLELARMRGRLPVIVGLAVPFRSEDEVGPAETAAREAAMTRARARLLKDLGVVAARDGSLSGPGIINVKLFETIPFLALTASGCWLTPWSTVSRRMRPWHRDEKSRFRVCCCAGTASSRLRIAHDADRRPEWAAGDARRRR